MSSSITRHKRIIPPFKKFGYTSLAEYDQYTMSIQELRIFLDSPTEKKKNTISQRERYEAMGAPPEIMEFVKFGGGPAMGAKCERFTRSKFTVLQNRKKGKGQSGHDQVAIIDGKEITGEEKSGGLHADGDFMWEHIEPNHPWDFLLFCGIYYHEIKFWVIDRKKFNELVDEQKITKQGNKAGDSYEGFWCKYSNVKDSLTEIKTNDDLVAFLKQIVTEEVPVA